MAKIESFRELDVWQAAMELALSCYRVTEAFPQAERFGLTAQTRRAATSVPANLAEGHNRRSRRAYLHHVCIALGSQAEVETLLELAARLGYVSRATCDALESPLRRTGQMLHGLARALENDQKT